MIGNIGGYVGLLLGFSILQAPELLLRLFATINGFYRQIVPRECDNGNNETLHVDNLSESGIPTENKNEIMRLNVEMAKVNSRLDRLEELIFNLVSKIEGKENQSCDDHNATLNRSKINTIKEM